MRKYYGKYFIRVLDIWEKPYFFPQKNPLYENISRYCIDIAIEKKRERKPKFYILSII